MSPRRLRPNQINRWKARSIRLSASINSVNRTSNRLRRWRVTYLNRHQTTLNLSTVMINWMVANFSMLLDQVEEASPMRITEATIKLKSNKVSQHRLRILSNPLKRHKSKQMWITLIFSRYQLFKSQNSSIKKRTCWTC